MSDESKPYSKPKAENVLFRSRIEICRILHWLAAEKSAISGDMGNSRYFISHILFVDPNEEFFLVGYSANKVINSELLKLPSVKFTADYHESHFSFEVFSPAEAQFDGQLVVRFDIPVSLVNHHRSDHPRVNVPPEISLRCIADADGFIPFESHITDISHDGLGGIIYDPDINVEPGTVLKGCRIISPNAKAVLADLEVRYVKSITLPDGSTANRAGFRFIQSPDEVDELINLFIQDMDKR